MKYIEEHGYTEGWEDCRAVRDDIGSQNHSKVCGKRMDTILSKDDPDLKEQVKARYVRIADAAMRISQRTAAVL